MALEHGGLDPEPGGPPGAEGRSVARIGVAVGALGLAVAALVGLYVWSGSRPARLIVDVKPANARITVGEHEARGHLDVKLPPGAVHVELEAAGHRSEALDLTLTPGAELTLSRTLPASPRRDR